MAAGARTYQLPHIFSGVCIHVEKKARDEVKVQWWKMINEWPKSERGIEEPTWGGRKQR